MKRSIQVLKNKSGFAYVPICAFVIIIAMLISILVQYSFVYYLARTQKQDIKLTLDSYITKEAIEYYDALKQGTPYTGYINNNELVKGAYSKIGFGNINTMTTEDEHGLIMHRPTNNPVKFKLHRRECIVYAHNTV